MKIQNEIMIVDTQIAISLARANYWGQYATSQANQARKIYKGFGDIEMTPLEKEQDAFSIANNHLHNAQKLMEEKQYLILKLEKSERETWLMPR